MFLFVFFLYFYHEMVLNLTQWSFNLFLLVWGTLKHKGVLFLHIVNWDRRANRGGGKVYESSSLVVWGTKAFGPLL